RVTEVANPEQTAPPARNDPSPTTSASFGRWWQESPTPVADSPLPITVRANDLLSSLELDSELREAFLTARQERKRRGKRPKSPIKAIASPIGVSPEVVENTDHGVREPTIPQLETVKEGETAPVIRKEPEIETDQVLLDEIHEVLEQQEATTPEPAIEQRQVAAFSSSLSDLLNVPLQRFLSAAERVRFPTRDLVEALAHRVQEIEKQPIDAKREFVEAILRSRNPALGLRWMVEARALSALGLLEVARMVEYSRELEKWRSPYHRTLRGLQQCTGPVPVRWAVLLHAIGVEETVVSSRKTIGRDTTSGYEKSSERHAAVLLKRIQVPEQLQVCILSLVQ